MKQAPRIRGGLLARWAWLVLGLAVVAAAIVSLLESRLGLAPWDVFHQGIARHSPLTLGRATIVVGLVIVLIAWGLGQAPGWGTLANALLIGVFVDAFASIGWVHDLSGSAPAVRFGLLLLGVALFGVGTAFYIGAGLGAGPRDSLMLVLSRRTGARIGVVRGALELTALAVGFALGGTLGVGTVAVALLIGASVEACFWLIARSPLAEASPAASVEP
jgi:uncharacterized membrane protein YczE